MVSQGGQHPQRCSFALFRLHPRPFPFPCLTVPRLPLLHPVSLILPISLPRRYGFLLRVKSMGLGSSIDRERKIATYWARLMDEAEAFDDAGREDDD